MYKADLFRFISTHFPILVSMKRFGLALTDAVSSVRATYSQNGEDRFILDELREINLSGFVYVDVGANQPTRISNTYLFYRLGLYGVTVEPNPQMKVLHRLFRPHDTFINVGCGNREGVFKFRHAAESVMSGFTSEIEQYIRTEYIPVLMLDTILDTVEHRPIFLLSVDVEGMDLEVLQGATKALSRTIFLLVEEYNADPSMREFIEQQGFVFVKSFRHNQLYRRLVV